MMRNRWIAESTTYVLRHPTTGATEHVAAVRVTSPDGEILRPDLPSAMRAARRRVDGPAVVSPIYSPGLVSVAYVVAYPRR